ncbi:MAG: GNAT family N-acetyltransferase [Parachlamydiaceae bacterium]|nr:GNAT family N-acetyltransferase [Parachlamydiaceae bacterium]
MSKSIENLPNEITVRYTLPSDGVYLKLWLMDEGTQKSFPMANEMEIDDAVNRWIAFSKFKCSLTVLVDNIPSGIATLYLQPYGKLAHQCEFGIIVDPNCRNLGIGSYLMNCLIHLAKTKFKIELLHLQVNGENQAMNLYKRFGFKEFGRQTSWLKEGDRYGTRVFMERFI